MERLHNMSGCKGWSAPTKSELHQKNGGACASSWDAMSLCSLIGCSSWEIQVTWCEAPITCSLMVEFVMVHGCIRMDKPTRHVRHKSPAQHLTPMNCDDHMLSKVMLWDEAEAACGVREYKTRSLTTQ